VTFFRVLGGMLILPMVFSYLQAVGTCVLFVVGAILARSTDLVQIAPYFCLSWLVSSACLVSLAVRDSNRLGRERRGK
jgi:hypothetical protein